MANDEEETDQEENEEDDRGRIVLRLKKTSNLTAANTNKRTHKGLNSDSDTDGGGEEETKRKKLADDDADAEANDADAEDGYKQERVYVRPEIDCSVKSEIGDSETTNIG